MKKIILIAIVVLFTTSFVYADHDGNEQSLKKTLKEFGSKSKSKSKPSKASQEKMKVFEQAKVDLKKSGILKNAVNKGQIAPNFILKDQNNKDVELYKLLEDGPVILLWYRGVWCPYCSITLRYYQKELEHFKEHNATLVAISPQIPDSTLSTVQKNELEYVVLSDVDNQVAREYGVVFTLDPQVAELYKQFGIDLKLHNGNERNELPLAATYVIDQNKKVRFAFLDVDYAKRAEPKHILNTLHQLEK